jgi:LysM repeat protein
VAYPVAAPDPKHHHDLSMRSTFVFFLLILCAGTAHGQNLRGSSASLDRQNEAARAHDFTYLRTPDHVRRFVDLGILVRIPGDANYEVLRSVSFPYARPQIKLFLERLSAQYHAQCGEKLVVTSLTRPMSNQPANASTRSVHPTGMAIDLRVPQNAKCRSWLETTLLTLERQKVLEAIRENRPPHYHVAVFPEPYERYVGSLSRQSATGAVAAAGTHTVRPGESLWSIARTHGLSVAELQRSNNLQGHTIRPGQVLHVR